MPALAELDAATQRLVVQRALAANPPNAQNYNATVAHLVANPGLVDAYLADGGQPATGQGASTADVLDASLDAAVATERTPRTSGTAVTGAANANTAQTQPVPVPQRKPAVPTDTVQVEGDGENGVGLFAAGLLGAGAGAVAERATAGNAETPQHEARKMMQVPEASRTQTTASPTAPVVRQAAPVPGSVPSVADSVDMLMELQDEMGRAPVPAQAPVPFPTAPQTNAGEAAVERTINAGDGRTQGPTPVEPYDPTRDYTGDYDDGTKQFLVIDGKLVPEEHWAEAHRLQAGVSPDATDLEVLRAQTRNATKKAIRGAR